MIINSKGYLCRRCAGGQHCKTKYREWFLIKSTQYGTGIIDLTRVILNKEYVGKKCRLKIELINDHGSNS
jgi:hypothetical protein